MSQLNLSSSTRKFIRLEKARIRRQFLDVKKQEEMIGGLYEKFLGIPEIKPETLNPMPTGRQAKLETNPKLKIQKAKTKAVKAKKSASRQTKAT